MIEATAVSGVRPVRVQSLPVRMFVLDVGGGKIPRRKSAVYILEGIPHQFESCGCGLKSEPVKLSSLAAV
jgi:hypothetical protein